VRRRRRIVACLAAVAVLAGAVGVVEVLRNGHTSEESAEQTGDRPPALPAADVPGALQRPDTVATDPTVIHFDVDAAALNAVELTWRSVWTQEGVSIRTADRGEDRIHFTISQEADRVIYGYPGGFESKFPGSYADPPIPATEGRSSDRRYPIGDVPRSQQIQVAGAPGPIKVRPDPADSTRARYLMVWSPVAGLTAVLEMVASNPDDVVRTSRAFRLDRSARCAVPGIARNAPGDARFFECETSLRTPDADGAFWNYSIITFSARGGNYVDVLFGNLTIPQPFEANRTVDGRPARWFAPTPDPARAKLEVPGEPGRHLVVSVRSWNFTEAEVQRIADSFRFTGDPRDIGTWPTNPAP
jgi:hypothetical protein